MEAFITIIGIGALLGIFSILSVLIGSDTRDAFTDQTLRPSFR